MLTRTYGLGGGIRCALDGDAVPLIAVPCDAWVGYNASFVVPARLERTESRPHELICFFAGVGDNVAAEGLMERALFVARNVVTYDNPLADPGLVGYRVEDEGGVMLGTIEAIFRTPAHFIWQIRSERGEHLIPAVDAFIVDVQAERRLAVVRPLPGMFDDEEPDDRHER